MTLTTTPIMAPTGGFPILVGKRSYKMPLGAPPYSQSPSGITPLSFGRLATDPAVEVYRGSHIDTQHAAIAMVVSASGQVQGVMKGTDDTPICMRSAIKPFQAFAVLKAAQQTHQPPLSPQALAIICGSHWGTPEATRTVESLLTQLPNAPIHTQLHCGVHPPLDLNTTVSLYRNHQGPSPLHHQCSGNHTGMLLASQWQGYPLANYTDPNHPHQQAVANEIKALTGLSQLIQAQDNCGVPAFFLPPSKAALLFAKLVSDPGLKDIAKAMTDFPDLVGGQGLDSAVMKTTHGRLVAKTGVNGIIGVGNRVTHQGLILRVVDGNEAIRDRLAVSLLNKIGWLTDGESKQLLLNPAYGTENRSPLSKNVGSIKMTYQWQSV